VRLGRYGRVKDMEHGPGGLEGLRSLLTGIDQQVLVKVVVDTDSGAASHLDAIVAPPSTPAGWQPMLWQYKPVTFIGGLATSRALASALDPCDAQALPLMGYALTLPVLAEQLRWERKPSRARWDSMVLTWPTLTFDLSRENASQPQNPSGYLIGDDCPSFFAYQEAFRAFFYGEFRRVAGQVPSDFAVIRVVDGSGWIERVLVTPTLLEGISAETACLVRV
jgi:hypothetical protein